MRHPLPALVRHWPADAREELAEREAILAADRLDPADAEAQVRRSWKAWEVWPVVPALSPPKATGAPGHPETPVFTAPQA